VAESVESYQLGQLASNTVAPGGAIGWKPAAEQRDLLLNAGHGVVLLPQKGDELGRLGACLQPPQQIA
jgi:hypothetical protein